MNVLIFGAGDLAAAFSRTWRDGNVALVGPKHTDVRRYASVCATVVQYQPDFIINCAGLSDRLVGATISEVVDVNLTGAMHVATAAGAYKIPALLVASTAGMQHPADHPWYGPAKAGVIAHVAALGKAGQDIWALSPNRMHTRMREADWPGEDPRTRLDPARDVVPVMADIIERKYPVGANVVVRKVGVSGRVDVFQAPTVEWEGML